MGDVIRLINITAFLNTLANAGAIKVSTFLDLSNPDRTVEQNLQRLLHVLEVKGTPGFIDFLACLRNEYAPSHDDLFKMLFKEGEFLHTVTATIRQLSDIDPASCFSHQQSRSFSKSIPNEG